MYYNLDARLLLLFTLCKILCNTFIKEHTIFSHLLLLIHRCACLQKTTPSMQASNVGWSLLHRCTCLLASTPTMQESIYKKMINFVPRCTWLQIVNSHEAGILCAILGWNTFHRCACLQIVNSSVAGIPFHMDKLCPTMYLAPSRQFPRSRHPLRHKINITGTFKLFWNNLTLQEQQNATFNDLLLCIRLHTRSSIDNDKIT